MRKNRAEAHDQMTDDLGNHLHKQVSGCFARTISLAEGDPERAFVISTFGLSAAIGFAAGSYAALIGADPENIDPLELAEVIIKMMREKGKPSRATARKCNRPPSVL